MIYRKHNLNVIQYNNLFQAYLLQESIYDILKD